MINIKVQARIAPMDAILRLLDLKDYGANIGEISHKLHISRPTVSKYCIILVNEGKLFKRILGRNVIYSLEKDQATNSLEEHGNV